MVFRFEEHGYDPEMFQHENGGDDPSGQADDLLPRVDRDQYALETGLGAETFLGELMAREADSDGNPWSTESLRTSFYDGMSDHLDSAPDDTARDLVHRYP